MIKTVVDCGQLSLANGEVSYSFNTAYNSVATYSCNDGYRLLVLTQGLVQRVVIGLAVHRPVLVSIMNTSVTQLCRDRVQNDLWRWRMILSFNNSG